MCEDVEKVAEMLRTAATTGEGFDLAGLARELELLPEKDKRAVLEKLAKEKGAGAVPLLLWLASVEGGTASGAAVQALGTIRDQTAASALKVLASGDASVEVRKIARRGLHRLASQGVTPPSLTPGEEGRPRVVSPSVTSVASPIDGAGNRAIWFGFPRGGEIDMLGLLLNDERGILDLVESDMSRPRFDGEVSKLLHDEELPWVEVPLDYCRHLVEQAHGMNAATGTPIPLEYLAWRDRIGKPEKEYAQPLSYTVIDSATVRWDPRYLDRSGDLFDLEMFRMWVLEREELEEFARERVMAEQSGLLLAGVRPEVRQRMVVNKAIQRLFDPRRRALYKRRLEEMAYLLWKLEWIDRARMALAAALALEPPDSSLLEHPFIRRLVEWSLEVVTASIEVERAKAVRPGVQLHLPY